MAILVISLKIITIEDFLLYFQIPEMFWMYLNFHFPFVFLQRNNSETEGSSH